MASTTLLEISCRGSYMLDSSVTISAFIHKLCKWAHLYCRQFNQLLTNGLSHPYHLDESTFILGAAGMTFHFYFAFYYIYIGSGTARFITVETRMFPDCAGIAPTPSRWRHGCSRRLPGLSRYLYQHTNFIASLFYSILCTTLFVFSVRSDLIRLYYLK